jgi:uncharacterized protein (DUF2267 family)
MQYDQFIGLVQHRAQLPSQGDAVAAVRSTLETLAERLTETEAVHLAAQLPREIAAYLSRPVIGQQALTLREFFERVSAREAVDLPQAVYHARVVAEVLREAVSPGEIKDVLAQLPPEFQPLFEGSGGELRTVERGKANRGADGSTGSS